MAATTRDIVLNVRANVVNVQQAMSQVSSSITQTTAAVKNSGPAFQTSAKDLGALANQSKLATTGIVNVGTAATVGKSKMQSFGDAFKGNRGIVFGIAGLTSALAEAVGMMGMYGDTALRLSEAQAKLNNLIDKGVTSGKAYTDAQAEVTKQQRFFNMVQRNTILSQMDMVFFTTMAVSGLIKLGTGSGKAAQMFQKLGTVFKGVKAEQQMMVPIMSNMNQASITAAASTTKLGQAMNFLKLHIRGLMAATVIGAVLVGIGFLIEHFMKMSAAAEEAAKKQKAAAETMKNDIEAWGALTSMRTQDALGSWEGLSEGATASMEAIVASIQKLSATHHISFLRAKMERAQESQDIAAAAQRDTQTAITAAENQIRAKFAGKDELIKKYIQEDANLKTLRETYKTLGGMVTFYGNTVTTLKTQLEGGAAGTLKWKMNTQEVMDVMNGATSDTQTLDAAVTQMFQDIQKGMAATPMKENLDQIRAAMVAYGEELKKKTDAEGKRIMTDEAANAIVERGIFLLNLLDPAMQKATKASKDLGNEIVILGGSIVGLSQQDLLTSFILQFNSNIKMSQSTLQGAAEKLDLVKTKYKGMLDAAELAGVGSQVLEALLRKEGASEIQVALGAAQYKDERDKAKEADKDATKEKDKLQKAQEKEKEELEDSIETLSKYGIAATMNVKINKLLIDAYMENAGAILQESDAILAKNKVMGQLDATQMAELVTSQQAILVEKQRMIITEQSKEGILARNKVIIEAAEAWTKEASAIFENNIAGENNRTMWAAAVQAEMGFIDTTLLTTEELKQLTEEGLNTTTDAAIKLHRVISEQLTSAMENLSSVIGAEDMKEFNKAFKDLDLGAIPDKLKDDVKRFLKDLRPLAEAGREAGVGLDVAILAIHGVHKASDELSKADIAKIVEKSVEQFGKFAALDPESWQLWTTFPELFKNLSKDTDKYQISLALLNQAIHDGGFTAFTAAQFLNAYVKEGGKLEDISEKDREKLALLGIEIDKNGKVTKAGTDETNAATEAIANMTIAATEAITITKMHSDMVINIMKMNLVMATNWSTTMETMWKLTGLFVSDEGGIQTLWADALIEMTDDATIFTTGMIKMFSTMVSGITALFGGTGGGGKGGKLTEVFFGPGGTGLPGMGGGGIADILKGGNQTSNGGSGGANPDWTKKFQQIPQSGGQGGAGGMTAQWSVSMLNMMKITAMATLKITEFFQTMVTTVGVSFSNLSLHWNAMALNMAKASSAGANIMAKNFASGVTQAGKVFSALSKHFNSMALNIAKASSSSANIMAKNYGSGVTKSGKTFSDLSKHFNSMALNIAKAASSSANKMAANFKSGVSQTTSAFSKLASHWSKVCNSIIANAKSAASGANKALAGIKDQEVKINFVRTGAVPNAKGGIYGMAEGGVISAQGGLTTSNGPTFVYGDNSGGREVMAFLPKDAHNADRIMDQLDTIFDRKKNVNVISTGGEKQIIIPITIQFGDQQFSFTRKYRIQQGSDIAQQVF